MVTGLAQKYKTRVEVADSKKTHTHNIIEAYFD
jgi:hypothetical protein